MSYRKTLVILLLALASANAMGDWTKLEKQSDSSSDVFYMDKSTIKKQAFLHKVWTLDDFKVAKQRMTRGLDMKSYSSSKSLLEFNCKEEMLRTLYTLLYAGPMATGEVIDTGEIPTNWIPVVPGSVGETIFSNVCGK